MSVAAVQAPQSKSRKPKTLPTVTPLKRRAAEELELIRWSAEEVVALRMLPYTSARVLKEKCYRREVYHHGDGGKISFSAASIRLENERTLVAPIAA